MRETYQLTKARVPKIAQKPECELFKLVLTQTRVRGPRSGIKAALEAKSK